VNLVDVQITVGNNHMLCALSDPRLIDNFFSFKPCHDTSMGIEAVFSRIVKIVEVCEIVGLVLAALVHTSTEEGFIEDGLVSHVVL
jgi:hypothetical protein